MSEGRKPRLTAKVLDGLALLASQAEAGECLDEGGELEDEAPTVRAACRWIRRMQRHRSGSQNPPTTQGTEDRNPEQ